MNLDEALDRRAANPLLVLAGGTDFYPSLGDKSPPTDVIDTCLLYTSPSPRDQRGDRMPSSA